MAKMKKQKMTKEGLIEQWEKTERKAKDLWREASWDIVQILKNNSLKEAQTKLRGLARRYKAMAISGYYTRAANEVAKLRRKK